MLVATASTFFVLNTAPVACVISLTEQKPLKKVWSECYFWSFPYYLLGAAIAGIVELVDKKAGWQSSLLILPVVYLIFRSYRLYLARLEAERNHAEGMAALHLRTIEALALAIEAKDCSTHEHLRRVQVYAMSIGKEMGLPESELEALRAAAVLHDIGKLAVPEHIISKPGRLTPEEFERMKIHPLVGAEILERVQFPCPVVPIVRAHHERWDGNGYPCGLRGQEIPTGARIPDTLEKLAAEPPTTKTALLCSLLFEIEAALRSGKTHKQIWQRLSEGSISRAKRFAGSFAAHVKEIAYPRRGGKSVEAPKLHVQPTATSVEHDPAANFRRVEAPRPGFHFRATHDVDVLVHGRRESHKQNKR